MHSAQNRWVRNLVARLPPFWLGFLSICWTASRRLRDPVRDRCPCGCEAADSLDHFVWCFPCGSLPVSLTTCPRIWSAEGRVVAWCSWVTLRLIALHSPRWSLPPKLVVVVINHKSANVPWPRRSSAFVDAVDDGHIRSLFGLGSVFSCAMFQRVE